MSDEPPPPEGDMSYQKTFPKQYVIMVDEPSMLLLSNLLPSLRYIAVEGMPIPGNDAFMCLVSPIEKSHA